VKLAILFPGQGAQAVGMGRALAAAQPLARETFEQADAALGYALTRVMWEGPEDELKKTLHTQPALLAHSIAAWRLIERAGITPAFTAGHSLGEYSACVAAGAITFEDAIRLVHRRGELMYQAGIERPGTMAALLGMELEAAEAVCADASEAGTVVPANLNAPGQVVISGEVAAIERACEIAKERGAKRAIRLAVSGAFHSPLMASAADGLRAALFVHWPVDGMTRTRGFANQFFLLGKTWNLTGADPLPAYREAIEHDWREGDSSVEQRVNTHLRLASAEAEAGQPAAAAASLKAALAACELFSPGSPKRAQYRALLEGLRE
jgi:[acyl-carrier-protein] S-malonyltransferase